AVRSTARNTGAAGVAVVSADGHALDDRSVDGLTGGGGGGNRTRVQGFADPCLGHSATPPLVLRPVRAAANPTPGPGGRRGRNGHPSGISGTVTAPVCTPPNQPPSACMACPAT